MTKERRVKLTLAERMSSDATGISTGEVDGAAAIVCIWGRSGVVLLLTL